MTLFVFLNNKLITIDTVLPLLVELRRQQPTVRIEFLCFEPRTEAAIRENVVVFEVLQEIGRLQMLGRTRPGRLAWLMHRAVMALKLAGMALRGRFGGAVFLHFKALNEWPLRGLFWLNRRRTCYVQASNLLHTQTERQVDQINKPRRHLVRLPAAGQLVAFDSQWPPLDDPRLAAVPRYLLPPPYVLGAWNDRLRSMAAERLAAAFAPAPAPESLVVFILSSMDPAPLLEASISFKALFVATLETLGRIAPALPVVVKPHPATLPATRAFLESVVVDRRAAGQDVRVSHLHPLLLAQRARFFIGNIFSSTFANAVWLNVPTVEYSHYGAATLAATGGGSIRPDMVTHFVNGDRVVLEALIAKLASATAHRVAPPVVRSDTQVQAFLNGISGGFDGSSVPPTVASMAAGTAQASKASRGSN